MAGAKERARPGDETNLAAPEYNMEHARFWILLEKCPTRRPWVTPPAPGEGRGLSRSRMVRRVRMCSWDKAALSLMQLGPQQKKATPRTFSRATKSVQIGAHAGSYLS